MSISYRTRQGLRRTGLILLILLAVLTTLAVCWFIWLNRFVIATRDGAVIDMELSQEVLEGEVAPDLVLETIPIYYNEGENAINTSKDITQLLGYYADEEALKKNMSMVQQQAKKMQRDTPVMLDVKDAKGRFFYSSSISEQRNSSIDTTAMDALIKDLDSRGVYLIARLPALRDYHFGLTQTHNGLFVRSGRYLWADDDYCYWLDPTKDGTIMYLVQIVTELKKLGFDEVVFDEFRFPDTEDLKFSGDRTEAINTAAKTLLSSCGDSSFAVSFVGAVEGFQLPQGRSRLYIKDATAADAAGIANNSGVTDPAIHLVFQTEFHDTRFNEYSVLRPIESAE